MVEALLDGRKTMTRRIMKPQPTLDHSFVSGRKVITGKHVCDLSIAPFYSPYGTVGDILEVRETFFAYGYWEKYGTTKKTNKQKWRFVDKTYWGAKMPDGGYKYLDNPPRNVFKGKSRTEGYYKRPSLFMPKGAVRIFLEITNVRIQKLNEISISDAVAEGIESFVIESNVFKTHTGFKNYDIECAEDSVYYKNPIYSFNSLWSSINGYESLNSNPFVWVIEFKMTEK
jgi:hypothetical protein